jgi:hypothetical protein
MAGASAKARPSTARKQEEALHPRGGKRRREEEPMERLAIVAHLKEGSDRRASELIGRGAPFDLADTGIVRHFIYLSASEVVFVFEGHEVEWIVDQLIDEPFHYELQCALEQWREIVDGRPRVARERFGWRLDEDESIALSARKRSESWA